jgi:transposase InsO family protein
MSERAKYVFDIERGLKITDACGHYGISRRVGHKWLKRYREEGLAGLADRSRRPISSPLRTDEAMVARVIETRQRRPYWGPKKLRIELQRLHPDLAIPANSTIGEILKRAGLVRPRVRRRKTLGGSACGVASEPNQVWCADYKGEFKLGCGRWCYPLTISDEASRYLLACRALEGTALEDAKAVFREVFGEYGLPEAIKTDNGSPFAGVGAGGLTRLSVWWLKLGIRLRRIEKGKPQQNGRHERMHGTLKAETARPPRNSSHEQQRAFEEFVREYNEERPHEGLGQRRPGEVYRRSRREMPRREAEPEYPAHWEKRRISKAGTLKFGGLLVFVSEPLAGEWVGLAERDNDAWQVEFAGHPIGTMDVGKQQFTPYGCTGGPNEARRYVGGV